MSSPAPLFEPTFRDPAGSLVIGPEGVERTVVAAHAEETRAFLQTPLAAALVAEGHLVSSSIVRDVPGGELVLSHPRIPMISYPSEWPPSLWVAAAELTLDLSSRLIAEGWILKDATPLNVLFAGTRPVFVDVLSIRRIDPTQPIWFAYGQFIRTFLLPLLAHTQLAWRLQTAQTWRDGIEPEELYRALPLAARMRYPARSFITVPVLLAKLMKSESVGRTMGKLPQQPAADLELTRRTLLKTVGSLRKALLRLKPRDQATTWSNYTETAGHYTGEDHREKREFVTAVLAACAPKHVLDVGSNTGNYSRLAAQAGAQVVAIDADTGALEGLFLKSRAAGDAILPLAVDLSFPTPATGWQNRESFSFLDRAEGHFDTVLMLAVIHHILLSSQIPLRLIAELCARITTRTLILEWVPPSDPRFVEVLRGRESIYTHLTEAAFREAFAGYFRIVQEQTLANGRILFHMVRADAVQG